jgi:hypothetical protein
VAAMMAAVVAECRDASQMCSGDAEPRAPVAGGPRREMTVGGSRRVPFNRLIRSHWGPSLTWDAAKCGSAALGRWTRARIITS